MPGARSQMLFLPHGPVEVPEDFSRLVPNSFTRAFPNGSSCENGRSGRTVAQHDDHCEVLLCDLVHSKLDLVYDNAAGLIFWRQDSTGLATKVFVIVLCVYIVSCVAENIKNVVSRKGVACTRNEHVVLGITLVFLAYELWQHELAACIVTQSELTLFYFLYVYVALECVLQLDFVCHSTLRSFISPLTVCLMLLLVRVYYTFDTPYTLPLTMLFGTRNWYKVLCVRVDRTNAHGWSDKLLLSLDLFVYSALLTASIQQHATSTVDGVCDQIKTLALNTLIGTVLFAYSHVLQ